MHLTYEILSLPDTQASILAFQQPGESAFWSDTLYHFYPELDRAGLDALPAAQRSEALGDAVAGLYARRQADFSAKLAAWQAHWDRHEKQIAEAFSDAFGEDMGCRWQHMRGQMSLNPVSPRFLEEARFEVCWLNSERGALGSALHEITHFLWFDAWQRRCHDDPARYERPHLPWLLSEMVVEPILSDPRLASLNPYYPRDQGGCIYPYFFDLRLEGKNLLDTLHGLYHDLPMGEFMDASYDLLARNQAELLQQVAAAESRPQGS